MRICQFSTALALCIVQAAAQSSPELDPPVRLVAGEDQTPIDTGADIGHAGPMWFDYNGDGKPDLLVSSFRGNIKLFANIGERDAPRFAAGKSLHASGEDIRIHNW